MSITEPFALANYNNSLYASANADNVSVAVQTDGIHVLQISTLRPIISRTLGPSTSFACPPLTVSDAHTYTVYAAIQSSQELEDQQVAGKSIWRWSEDLNSSIADRAEAHKKKLSVTVPHTITGLHYVPELAGYIIVISHNGSITTVQSDTLQVQSTWEQHNGSLDDTLVKSFVYSRAECSFLPRNMSQEGAVIVLVLADSKTGTTRLEIVCITNEERESIFAPIGCCQTDFKQSDILDISFSSMGLMSVITTEGKWFSFTIDSSPERPFSLSQFADPFRLKNLCFALHQLTLLPLTCSHALLAAVSSSKKEIYIQIWDLQYTVILASQVLPIPSSFTLSPALPVSITLIPSSSATSKAKGKDSFTHSQVVLVISHSPSSAVRTSNGKNKNKSKAGRSTTLVPSALFVVPYVVPIISTIGNAIGKASASAPWIALPENSDNANGLDEGRKKVLQAMKTEMESNRPQAANEAFFNWKKGQPGLDKGSYGHDFVKQVLHVVLQPTKSPASVMYSSIVVRHLIDRRVVSNDMVEGGLVRLLKAKNDWESIKLVLMNVVDVSELELVEALTDVVAKHGHQPGGSNLDAMQVDVPTIGKSSSADVPPLPVFLSYCVKYRSTPSHLRIALKQQQLHPATSMTSAECAVEILKVLIKWIEEWSSRDIPLFPAAANEDVKVRKIKVDGMPEFGQIVSFIETFLDATFLSLLPYKPAQEVLQRLAALLQPEITFMQSVQPLYGVLDGFAQCKVLREAKGKGASGGKGPSTGEERQEDKQRKKRVHEQSVMGIGLYQVEELML